MRHSICLALITPYEYIAGRSQIHDPNAEIHLGGASFADAVQFEWFTIACATSASASSQVGPTSAPLSIPSALLRLRACENPTIRFDAIAQPTKKVVMETTGSVEVQVE